VERGIDATVTVTAIAPRNILVRVPRWVRRGSICLSHDATPVSLNWRGDYLQIECSNTPATIRLQYALPERRTVERTQTGQTYRFRWRGDQIVGIYPNDPVRPFYPTDAELAIQ
jgi:hypothetical protein